MSHDLTRAQRDRFARNGFVVLRGAVDDEIIADAGASVAETVPEDFSDFEALAASPERRNYWGDLEEMEPFGRLNRRLSEFAESLVGEGTLEPPGEFVQAAVRYPEGEFASDPNRPTTAGEGNPHVDGFESDGTFRPFSLGATTYLDDVAPQGGGLTVWPGSHWRVAEFFAENDAEDFSNDEASSLVGDAEPFEVTGRAGTVVLWHSLLVHTGGVHLGRRPRVAAFTRFVRQDVEETKYDALAAPFEFLDGVDPREDVRG
ncbi:MULTISPECIES: phytanoyl-CoA dioxygenase family protein [Halorussus]|uniref:phytanoyl-CoA dioxygenase family protein n=1 Tax=Halorussus TaxID=1070314 RepID=UPI0020A18AA5|nr:phytanoyl-CoA dioxygenase family protein [Halorussus vallis]USZ78041.1 phytanoyl-CoA dioxygenase family protein [Halorussus vallis]